MAKSPAIYLSYNHRDADYARSLARALGAKGFKVWDPVEELLPGDNWALGAGEALQRSDAMIVLLSPDALASELVMREIDFALTNHRFAGRLFPVVVKPVQPKSVPWVLDRFLLKEANPLKAGARLAEALGGGDRSGRG